MVPETIFVSATAVMDIRMTILAIRKYINAVMTVTNMAINLARYANTT
jgi:hypothetical protein